MRLFTPWLCCLWALPLLLEAPAAAAHLSLLEPLPRVEGEAGNNQQKSEPCGQTQNGRTSIVTVYEPGATITVSFSEYIDHPSYYRIAFDVEGDDSFPHRPNMSVSQEGDDPTMFNPVSDIDTVQEVYILQYFLDDLEAPPGGEQVYTTSVTLPNVECENCTLQVIQFMYDRVAPYYFQCADIALRVAGGGTGGATATANGQVATTTASTTLGNSTSTTGTSGGGGESSATSMGTGGTFATTAVGTSGSTSNLATSSATTTLGAGTTTAGVSSATSNTASGGSATLGSVGNTGLAQPGVPVPVEEAGCSCRNQARSSGGNWGLLLLTLGLVGYRRRRGSTA